MKIVNIIGGLGNQLFQYAFAIALQERNRTENVKIDISGFNGYPLHNKFEIEGIFPMRLKKATVKEILTVSYPTFHYRLWQIQRHLLPALPSQFRERKSMVFQPEAFDKGGNCYYDGYWQSEKYFSDFRESILDAFIFPEFQNEKNIHLVEYMKGKTFVSIHVRRGDYVKHKKFGGICTSKYYKEAIGKIGSLVDIDGYLLFSNDMEWCRRELAGYLGKNEVIFVDWNKGKNSFRDIQLMSLCSHNIVANSSFSWWGAWLNTNKNKIVIAPDKWKNVDYKLDIIPQSWIKIDI